MKSKISLISILVIAFAISCTTSKNVADVENHEKVQNSNIEGVWKLVYSDLLVKNLPEEVTHYKIIVDGRFFWYQVNNEWESINPSDGAGGVYYLEDDSYTEHVEHVLPQMEIFKGKDYITKFEISGNILKTKGSISGTERTFEEVFEKVSVNDENFAEIKGVWKLLNSNLIAVAQDVTRYKLIVDNCFLYYEANKDGLISKINGLSGNLEKRDSIYMETVKYTLPDMEDWLSTQSIVHKYEISKFQDQGDILKVQGENNNIGERFTEVFEKVKTNDTRNTVSFVIKAVQIN